SQDSSDEPAPAEQGHVDDPENSDGSTLERHEDEVLYVKRGSLRRRPKYGVFGTVGGLIGLIAGLVLAQVGALPADQDYTRDRKSTRLNSSHVSISYAVFCLKKKK